ncbi:LOW QUALITY PROTEIN: hypothetical protein KIPB_011389 [Kipferlia bialata]|uniref:Uncharacterized protein n=1 Tax=Kipferlia bialata TaxID=797122 RepID=A0A9K3D611_9EUKA|nr:LOW QUALITY PROTEIN: hypothetical protein KIPB_011389 [Kipferlia bialata]
MSISPEGPFTPLHSVQRYCDIQRELYVSVGNKEALILDNFNGDIWVSLFHHCEDGTSTNEMLESPRELGIWKTTRPKGSTYHIIHPVCMGGSVYLWHTKGQLFVLSLDTLTWSWHRFKDADGAVIEPYTVLSMFALDGALYLLTRADKYSSTAKRQVWRVDTESERVQGEGEREIERMEGEGERERERVQGEGERERGRVQGVASDLAVSLVCETEDGFFNYGVEYYSAAVYRDRAYFFTTRGVMSFGRDHSVPRDSPEGFKWRTPGDQVIRVQCLRPNTPILIGQTLVCLGHRLTYNDHVGGALAYDCVSGEYRLWPQGGLFTDLIYGYGVGYGQ